ncbi:bidirectional sugar transporter SWEET1-like [Mercurialis annua]|uniref:bidirectional sugar transporter SWEET1-like n=1 Tax=Mercurialis annua TaxID=3986 RepID=UPI00215F342C|nr:bidirectional sugar transporter SWEET1-like [Mercurialis annua]
MTKPKDLDIEYLERHLHLGNLSGNVSGFIFVRSVLNNLYNFVAFRESAWLYFLTSAKMDHIELRHILLFTFGILGLLFQIVGYLDPLSTIRKMVHAKSTTAVTGLPAIFSLLSSLLYAWYGTPLVSSNNLLVCLTNGIGAAVYLTFVVVYIVYSTNVERVRTVSTLVLTIMTWLTIALPSLFISDNKEKKLFCGSFAAIGSAIAAATPFSILRTVVMTRDAGQLSSFSTIFTMLSTLAWSAYGFMHVDPFVIIPNLYGCGVSIIQLLLIRLYPTEGHETDTEMIGHDMYLIDPELEDGEDLHVIDIDESMQPAGEFEEQYDIIEQHEQTISEIEIVEELEQIVTDNEEPEKNIGEIQPAGT